MSATSANAATHSDSMRRHSEVSSLSVVEVARTLGLPLKPVGSAFYTRCPINEHDHDQRSPKLQLGGQKAHLWHCHKCNQGGDAVGLVKAVKGCDAKEAYSWLREKGFLPGKASRPVYSDPLHELAARRDWSIDAMNALSAHAEGKCVLFPMRDDHGEVTGHKRRRGDNSPFRMQDGGTVKSLTGRGERNGLFYSDPLPPSGRLLIAEGEADTVAAITAGHDAVVGTPGAAVGKAALGYLQRIVHGREVLLAPDPDAGGRSWLRKVGRACANAQCSVRFIAPDGEHDLDDRLRSADDKAVTLQALIENALPWQDDSQSFFEGKTFIPLRLARAIAADRQLTFGFDPERGSGQVMECRQGVWRYAVGLDVDGKDLLGEEYRPGRVRDALEALKVDLPRVAWRDWNANRQLVNCLSGMLDPQTLKLYPHAPEYYSTFQVPVEWNPDAECEELLEFLGQVLEEDCLEIACFMMGYLLVPNLSCDKLFVLHGPARTGKTTFLEAFQNMLGERNWELITLQQLADDKFALARLQDKLVGMFDDLDSAPLKSTSIPKALTGGFRWLEVERKHQDGYKAPLYTRFLFTCNEVPNAPDKSGAWYRRLCLIPFQNIIAKPDPTLADKLNTPLARQTMLKMAVLGLRALIADDWCFPEPESVGVELAEYRLKNDSVAAFVHDACVRGADRSVRRFGWYQSYSEWCKDGGMHPLSARRAYERLRQDYNCLDRKDERGVRWLDGIGLLILPQEEQSSEGNRG